MGARPWRQGAAALQVPRAQRGGAGEARPSGQGARGEEERCGAERDREREREGEQRARLAAETRSQPAEAGKNT